MSGRPANHPRPPHTCTTHPAGSRCCYNHGCRCRQCTDAYSRYSARHNHGTTRRVPASIILDHLHRLYAAGMIRSDIVATSGIDEATLRAIEEGRTRNVNRATAAALLACRPTPGLRTPGAGTARRLQALALIGWTTTQLVDHTGLDPIRLRDLRQGRNERIDTGEARAVAAAYEALWDQPQTATRWNVAITSRASRYGWRPPAAWDDGRGPHGIDNPRATPAGAAHQPKVPAADLVAEVEQLIGTPARLVAHALGYDKPKSLATRLRRLGRDDLANRFERVAA